MSALSRFVAMMTVLVIIVGVVWGLSSVSAVPMALDGSGVSPQPSGSQTVIIDVGQTFKAGDNSITIHFKDDQGKTHTLGVHTGEEGSGKTGDDIPKGLSATDKVVLYKDAVKKELGYLHSEDPALHDAFDVSVRGDMMFLDGKKGNKLTRVSIVDQTGEDEQVIFSKDDPPPPASRPATPASRPKKTTPASGDLGGSGGGQDAMIATVALYGVLTGFDTDGNSATVTVSVGDVAVELPTASYYEIVDLIRDAALMLRHQGVAASVSSDGDLVIVLDGAAPRSMGWHATDAGLTVEGGLEMVVIGG